MADRELMDTGAGLRRRKRPSWSAKRRRMLVLLGLMLLALLPGLIWRARLGVEVRERVAQVEAAGMPVRLEQLDAGLPAVSEDQNAAPIYLEAARHYVDIAPALWDDLPFGGRVPLVPGQPLAPDRLAAMRALVAANDAALANLRDAASVPVARYIASYGDGRRPELGHIESVRPLAPLLCAHALVLAEEGRGDAALAALSDAVALARSLASDGTFLSLINQWEMESEIQETLAYVFYSYAFDDAALAPFVAHFTVAQHEQQIRRMLEVEQGLFLARIRESRRRGLLKNLVVSAGIGDLNLRAGLVCMAIALEWPGADLGARQRLEADYNAAYRGFARSELLYATFRTHGVPVRFPFYREHLDRAAVTEVALALYRYRASNGAYPEATDVLVPGYLDALPVLASSGGPVVYQVLPEGAAVHNGGDGEALVRFVLGSTGPLT